MDLRALLDRLRRREQDRLVQEGLNERAVGEDDVKLTPGLDREIRSEAERLDDANEHYGP